MSPLRSTWLAALVAAWGLLGAAPAFAQPAGAPADPALPSEDQATDEPAEPPPAAELEAPFPSPEPAAAEPEPPPRAPIQPPPADDRADPPWVRTPPIPPPEEPSYVAPREEKRPAEPHMLDLALGLRSLVIPHAGLDPYADNDAIAMGGLMLTVTPLRFGIVGLGVTADYSYGSKSAFARDDQAGLSLHRLGLGVKGGVTLADRLELFARVAPGALLMQANIEDSFADSSLLSSGWTWNVDLVGGAAVKLGAAGRRPAARFWLLGEAGYSFAGDAQMVFAPEDLDDDPRSYGAVRLPDLNPGGFTGRFAFAVSFL